MLRGGGPRRGLRQRPQPGSGVYRWPTRTTWAALGPSAESRLSLGGSRLPWLLYSSAEPATDALPPILDLAIAHELSAA
jgi:hypothetical protein